MTSEPRLEEGQLRPHATAARTKARVIIPVWGAKYLAKLDAACLPALLAPGNLPHLAKHFDCELVIVTQAALFGTVRGLTNVQAAAPHAELRLIPMDDVLSHQNFYGYTITHALYRGFIDLGEAAKDTWCVFLNADFILADGSYRAMADRMLAGERIIFSPSYCTIEERVRPVLNQKMEDTGGILALPPREMASLILDHRHYTMRAKTINSRMYRIDHVDQLYYQLDDDTLIGRQIPIAVVAFRPERVPRDPIAFWDYGVISEFCPTARLCVLGDSDDFLMMELRGKRAMADWLKLGWMDPAEIARSLSNWMTRDQQRCSEFPLVLHRRELPADLERGKKALAEYYEGVMSRLANPPRDYRDHYIWTGAVELHNEWLKSRGQKAGADGETVGPRGSPRRSFGHLIVKLVRSAANTVARGRLSAIYRPLFDFMRAAYLSVFGRAPDVGPLHPQFADLRMALDEVESLRGTDKKVLAFWRVAGASVAPQLSRWARNTVNADHDELASAAALETLRAQGPFDVCLLELSKEEFGGFAAMHARLRGLMRTGGRVVVFCQLRHMEQVVERDFALISGGLPEQDVAELQFRGGFLAYVLQRLWEDARVRAQSGRAWDLIRLGLVSAAISPFSLLANRASARRQAGRFPGYCTSMLLTVTVA